MKPSSVSWIRRDDACGSKWLFNADPSQVMQYWRQQKKKKGPASRGRLHNQDDCQARQDEQDLDVCGCTVSSDDDILVDQ